MLLPYFVSALLWFNFVLEKEPNMLKVKEPVVIIGDIHGQFYDMVHMFEKVIDPRGLPAYVLFNQDSPKFAKTLFFNVPI